MEENNDIEKQRKRIRIKKSVKYMCLFSFFFTLTGEDNEENDCNVNEEELEVPKVTEDLMNKSGETILENTDFYLQPLLI